MNISNTISYDSQYPKSDSGDVSMKSNIKQSEIVVKDKIDFKENMKKVEEKKDIDDLIDNINKSNKEFKTFNRKLEMSVHSKTREIMVKVIDTVTDEVIREVPPEKVLDGVAYRREIAGILMDKKI